MKLRDAREAYYDYSGKASAASRSLSFAAIAVIWIFKAGEGLSIKIPETLILPLTLFVCSLACDLAQYVIGSFIWGAFHRWKEIEQKKLQSETEFKASPYLNWPTLIFYWLKLLFVVFGYGKLLAFLSHQVLR